MTVRGSGRIAFETLAELVNKGDFFMAPLAIKNFFPAPYEVTELLLVHGQLRSTSIDVCGPVRGCQRGGDIPGYPATLTTI